MSDYLLGLLTIPAAAVALVVAWVVCRGLLWLGAQISITAINAVRKDMSDGQRAHFAALCYGAERGWLFAMGDLGIAVFVGQDDEARRAAYERVVIRRSFKLAPKWAERAERAKRDREAT